MISPISEIIDPFNSQCRGRKGNSALIGQLKCECGTATMPSKNIVLAKFVSLLQIFESSYDVVEESRMLDIASWILQLYGLRRLRQMRWFLRPIIKRCKATYV